MTLAGRRYIVCRNHQEAEKDAADRDLILVALKRRITKGGTALIANTGERTAPPSKTKFLLDGNVVLGIIDTPSLAAHGWGEVTVQLDTDGRTGQHTVDVIADSANEVDESSETNNGNTTTINLQ